MFKSRKQIHTESIKTFKERECVPEYNILYNDLKSLYDENIFAEETNKRLNDKIFKKIFSLSR